ncbi:Flap-structured DNA-binding and RNA-binding protein [Umbelopsis sp. WA50703]
MNAHDQLGAMLSPAHPEKGDLQAQMVGAMAKAEKEASQKLLSVLPYQTGQVTRRPPESLHGPRRTLDRHSFAIGDTEEYKGLFPVGSEFLSPHPSTFGNTSASLLDDQSLLSRAHLKPNDKTAQTGSPLFGTRPRSVVESGDLSSSLLGNEWPQQTNRRTANNVGHIGDRSMNGRPKSADVTNWYNSDIPPPIGDKGLGGDRSRPFSSNSPWNLTPSVSSFTERDANVDRPNSVSDVDLQNALASWSLANNLGYPRANMMMNDDSKGYRRRPMARGAGIPRTVPESEEQGNFYSKFGDHERGSEPNSGGSTLTGSASQSRSVSRSASPAPSASNSSSHFGNASFGMWSGKHLSVPGLDKQIQQPQPQHTYGQFLNPSDAHLDGGDLDYVSDHSDTSVISSNGTRRRRTSATGNSRAIKDKKAAEVVDMELLQDVPAWFRSLRLHKYNTVFESMKWQDIIKLSDEDLVAKGVAALGARRKMLKVFENVRAHCDANNIQY